MTSTLILALFFGANVIASVSILFSVVTLLQSILVFKVGAPTGSTPMTRISFFIALAAMATPEISPPQPMPTTTTSISGV